MHHFHDSADHNAHMRRALEAARGSLGQQFDRMVLQGPRKLTRWSAA